MTTKERKAVMQKIIDRKFPIPADLPYTKSSWREAYNKGLEDASYMVMAFHLNQMEEKGINTRLYYWDCLACGKVTKSETPPPSPQVCNRKDKKHIPT